MALPLLGANLAMQAGSQILQGIGGIVSGIAGSRQRRREQADAARSYTDAMARFENIDTSNPYANITNPYANLTVNQQQADFMAQQTQQASANTMSQLSAAAGGSGIASLAQAMANQQTRNLQQASATIGAQEAANQRLTAQGDMQTQMARAQGDYLSQRMQANQATTQLAMAQRRKAAADQARQQATGALVGGIGKIAGGVMSGFTADKALKGIGMDGLFGGANSGTNQTTNPAGTMANNAEAAPVVTSNFNPQVTGSQSYIDNVNAFMEGYQTPSEAAGFNVNVFQDKTFVQNANGTFKWNQVTQTYEKID
tara:strand:- start:9383 stop:10321 length:939 start_codon:yes stop_codon:yes gene_type:complete